MLDKIAPIIGMCWGINHHMYSHGIGGYGSINTNHRFEDDRSYMTVKLILSTLSFQISPIIDKAKLPYLDNSKNMVHIKLRWTMFLQLWLIIEHFIYLSSADKNCKAVGMPRSSLYYILDYNPDAPTEAQELYSTSNREQLE
jgi:hypothetical protein